MFSSSMLSRRLSWIAMNFFMVVSTIAAQEPAAYLVTNVDVIPMNADRVLKGQNVLIQNSRIVAMGPTASVHAPDNSKVIDGLGKYLMPGLFDMHIHVHEPERDGHLALYLASCC